MWHICTEYPPSYWWYASSILNALHHTACLPPYRSPSAVLHIAYTGPGGTSISGGGGGLGPHIKFGGKIWSKVQPSSPNKRKNLGSSVTTRRKSWEKIPILGVISEIQRAKFAVFVTYIFGDKLWDPTRISEANYGAKPPRPPNMEVPLWDTGWNFFIQMTLFQVYEYTRCVFWKRSIKKAYKFFKMVIKYCFRYKIQWKNCLKRPFLEKIVCKFQKWSPPR